jgi:hypothetical protein
LVRFVAEKRFGAQLTGGESMMKAPLSLSSPSLFVVVIGAAGMHIIKKTNLVHGEHVVVHHHRPFDVLHGEQEEARTSKWRSARSRRRSRLRKGENN